MLFDRQNSFHDNVTLANGANNGDVIDMGVATDLGEAQVGIGHGAQVPELFLKIGTKANADNTVAIVLSGSANEDMSGATAVLTIAAVNVAAGGTKRWSIPRGIGKFRYFRAVVTVAGTTASIANGKLYLNTTAAQRSLAGDGLI